MPLRHPRTPAKSVTNTGADVDAGGLTITDAGVSITPSPDELTAAWTSGSGDIYVAERLTYKDPFGPPIKVNNVALATDRVALAPTGRTLIAVRNDRAAFVGFEKSSTTGEWAVSTGLEFTQVRVAFEGNVLASDPVLSGDNALSFSSSRRQTVPQSSMNRSGIRSGVRGASGQLTQSGTAAHLSWQPLPAHRDFIRQSHALFLRREHELATRRMARCARGAIQRLQGYRGFRGSSAEPAL